MDGFMDGRTDGGRRMASFSDKDSPHSLPRLQNCSGSASSACPAGCTQPCSSHPDPSPCRLVAVAFIVIDRPPSRQCTVFTLAASHHRSDHPWSILTSLGLSTYTSKLLLCVFEQLQLFGLKINFHKSEIFCYREAKDFEDQYIDRALWMWCRWIPLQIFRYTNAS